MPPCSRVPRSRICPALPDILSQVGFRSGRYSLIFASSARPVSAKLISTHNIVSYRLFSG
jgi:hypothetical protein